MNRESESIIFFDGECNFCNFTIKYIIKYIKNASYRFSAQKSKFALRLFREIGVKNNFNSIILMSSGKLFYEAEAIFKIIKNLRYPAKFLYVFNVFPKFINMYLYKVISNNRNKIYNKKMCKYPEKDISKLFIIE